MAKKHTDDFDDDTYYDEQRGTNDRATEDLFDPIESDADFEDETREHSGFEFDDDDTSGPGPEAEEHDHDSDDIEQEQERSPEKAKKRRGNAKPRLIGKHSLAYDTIFKGRQNAAPSEDAPYQSEHIIRNAGGSLDISETDLDAEESRNSIDSYREVRLKREINTLLRTYTDINFTANRRKPAKTDFNAYYAMLLKELSQFGYSRTEIFIELSGYFSDNIWNMFQLLDKQYSSTVILELKEKYGLSDMNKVDFLM